MAEITLKYIPWGSDLFARGKQSIREGHYLHKMPDPRTSYEMYAICSDVFEIFGFMVFGRPQNCRCKNWFGKLEDWQSGHCEITNWQVLNLARVWIKPEAQKGGKYCSPRFVPGFIDRRGDFQSTLASEAIGAAVRMIGEDYLVHRPPVNLAEPYEIRWLLSHCDTRFHRGTIYQASGFELFKTNAEGIQTWRIRLPWLSQASDERVQEAARRNKRSLRFWAKRAQQVLF